MLYIEYQAKNVFSGLLTPLLVGGLLFHGDLLTTCQGAELQSGHAPMPLLMPHDFSELILTAWRVEPATPDPQNPLLEGQMPWDAGGVGSHGTVLHDPIDGLYKAWLVCEPPRETLERALGVHHLRKLCYFESPDGVLFKPVILNTYLHGERKTNIVFADSHDGCTQYASVIIDKENRDWPYQMFVYRYMYVGRKNKPPRGIYRYRSRDGKKWEKMGRTEGPFGGDVCFIYRNWDEPGYVTYYRILIPDPGAHLPCYETTSGFRAIFRAISPDGQNWTDNKRIIHRDQRDHRDTQYMELIPHRVTGGYLGMVTMYHPLTQTLDLRLAASRDGIQWWFPDRRPCLPNPPLGDYGGGMIWQNKDLIRDGNRLYVYYGGSEGPHRQIWDTRFELKQIGLESVVAHRGDILPFNSALCRASWPIDRLYALISSAGGPTVGMAITKPTKLTGKSLSINFKTRPPKKADSPGFDEGYIQIELLDAQGQALKGFARADCPQLKGDHHISQVKWTGGAIVPPTAVKAKFYLKRAFLYGFEWK
jgi:hypothetical protein